MILIYMADNVIQGRNSGSTLGSIYVEDNNGTSRVYSGISSDTK